MKLIYSIPEKIWFISNFLDHNMYKQIHNSIIKERKDINLCSSKGVWSDNLIDNLVPPLRNPINNYAPFEHLKTLVRHNPYFQLKNLKEMSSIIHYMKTGSGINWHDDGSWKYGATYYVNNRWHRQWGGEFMFMNETAHGFVPIIGNSLVIIKSPMDHKVNPVLSPIMPRISIQMFMK